MYSTVQSLLGCKNEAIVAFTKRDLLNQKVDTSFIKDLPEVKRIINKQESDGRWKYPTKQKLQKGYDSYETMKMLGELVQKYGLNKSNEAVRKGAEFLLSIQTKEGDFRGIYGNQYSPNYSATMMEFLIMAGYDVDKGLKWLLKARQEDMGWAIPFRTQKIIKWTEAVKLKTPLQPDKTKRFSHMVTGIVLRPFSLLPKYYKEVKTAAQLLADSIFERDKYVDRAGVEFWTHFTYPYQWTDILNVLDTLSRLGIKDHPKIKKALEWFKQHQKPNGLWNFHRVMGTKDSDSDMWINLQIARVLKRF
jgi:hypothetical protein